MHRLDERRRLGGRRRRRDRDRVSDGEAPARGEGVDVAGGGGCAEVGVNVIDVPGPEIRTVPLPSSLPEDSAWPTTSLPETPNSASPLMRVSCVPAGKCNVEASDPRCKTGSVTAVLKVRV